MPTFSPADLRAGRLHFLLDLTWGGQVYRLAESVIAPTLDGETLQYHDGLLFGGSWEERLDLFGVVPSSRSVSLTLSLADVVDVPARIADGHPLGSASGKLSLWVEGTTKARVIVAGGLRQIEHQTKDDPVIATLEEAPLRAPGLIPEPAQRIGPPSEDDDGLVFGLNLLGHYYPIIFGRPGGAAGYGSPALYFDVAASTGEVVLAAHECVGGSVLLIDATDEATDTATIKTERDSLSGALRTAATTTLSGTFPHAEAKHPVYVRWTDGNAGGVPSRSDPSVPMRGAGEILSWLLERSGARVDHGRMRALEPLLAGYRLDAAIIPGRDERVSPIEWIQTHLLPILPLSARVSGDGLHYVYWRWDATARDAVTTLSADEHQCERVGPVQYSEADDVCQEIRFGYARDYAADKFQSTLLYTGVRATAGLADANVLEPNLERSFWQHIGGDPRLVRTLEVSSEVVLEDATAHIVCQYLARRHGAQTRLVRYEADPEFAWLEPGDVVVVTDEDVGFASAVALVETAIWSTDERVGLGLRLLN